MGKLRFGLFALIMTSALALAAFRASAADMSAGYKEGCCASVQTWTGFYAGVNFGGSFMNNPEKYSKDSGAGAISFDSWEKGEIGGGQIGYNLQVGTFVIGVEADFSDRNLYSDTVFFPFGNLVDMVGMSQSALWLGTVRPRAGFAAGDWLFYATGGFAYGDVHHGSAEQNISAAGNLAGQSRDLQESVIKTGWAYGGGIDWALLPNWSIGVEYLHIDLGTATLSLPTQTVGGLLFTASTAHFEDQSDIVRAKINYHFLSGYVPLK
jgi:outer membrane immunogenic protein